jgi:TonB family protein
MATASPFLSPPATPDSFADALEGVIVGVAGLELARCALAALLDRDEGAATAQDLLDDAHEQGRLGAGDYAALTADINRYLGEDVPTEWSEDLVDEAAPGSDTLSPGEAAPAARPRSGTGLQPGAVLMGRFVLQGRLGTTGSSDILKAIDRQRQQAHEGNPWVVLKLAVPGTAHHGHSLQMLQREATFAGSLQHPHIARVFDFIQDDDHALLAMEWLDGESLAELLTRQRYRPLTLAHTRQILTEIAGALQFAHDQGITHADVKPGNIFITRDGSAKLLDFGVARSSADAPQPATARTPAYASCEILEGAPPLPQDDVYSLACVAYRMLAGRRVFGHHDALAAEQSGRKASPVRDLPAAQWAALEQALALRRDARTRDVASFISAFNSAPPVARATYRAAAPATQAAVASSTPAASPRAGRSSRLPLALVAGTLAAIGLFVMLRQGGAPDAQEPVPLAGPIPTSEMMPAPAPAAAPMLPDAGSTTAAIASPAMAPAVATAPAAATPATDQAVKPRSPQEHAAPSSPSDPPATSATSAAPAPAAAAVAAAVAATEAAEVSEVASVQPDATGDMLPAPTPAGASGQAAAIPAVDSGPREVALGDLDLQRYVKPAEPQQRPGMNGRGWVLLAFVVGTDGHTREVQVTGAEPAGIYDEVALRAVQRWRFAPVIEDGRPVERRSQVRLRFEPAP